MHPVYMHDGPRHVNEADVDQLFGGCCWSNGPWTVQTILRHAILVNTMSRALP